VLLEILPYVVVVVGARLENYWTPADRASSVLSFHLLNSSSETSSPCLGLKPKSSLDVLLRVEV
jgi:hypothetical protein